MRIFSLPRNIALRILFAFGFGFFLSMFTRAVANIIKPHVQADLALTEEALSLSLGTSFFIAFGLMQLPLGVLLDRYDPRKVNASLMLIAALGAVTFALAEDSTMLAVGRSLMGLGFAAGMMASLKTYSLWFPVEKLPTINGVQFAIGVVGAVSATKPTEWALRVMSWQDLTLIFAGFTVLAAIVLVTVAPKHVAGRSGESLKATIGGLKRIYTDAFFWRIVPWITLSMGISQGIGTLYVFSWLTDVADYTSSGAASVLTLTASIAVVNFLAMGPIAEALTRRGLSPLFVPVVGLVASMLAMGLLVIQLTTLAVPVWVFWNVAIGTNVLMFAALAQSFPVALAGRVYTAINLLGFGFTALSQWSVGFMLDLFPGEIATGYMVAFGVLLGVQGLGGVWYFLATRAGIGKETMLEKEAEAARAA